MLDGSLILALVSTGAAVLNGIGLLFTWMKYKELAHESLIFASEVIGTLYMEEENSSPPSEVVSIQYLYLEVVAITHHNLPSIITTLIWYQRTDIPS
ncbi:hypothetical protein [uncultured Methanospirillum sp.]|uniref:hypothetical protein n=1 Tax=uncultured Methanospirillum sp. TaxID=262503 RepID=UPI0029C65325|nr:hypothetical protein [uncultured Methanospirillum sp.]